MKIDHPTGKIVFQLSFFRGYVKLGGASDRNRFTWSIDMSMMRPLHHNVVWTVMIDGKRTSGCQSARHPGAILVFGREAIGGGCLSKCEFETMYLFRLPTL